MKNRSCPGRGSGRGSNWNRLRSVEEGKKKDVIDGKKNGDKTNAESNDFWEVSDVAALFCVVEEELAGAGFWVRALEIDDKANDITGNSAFCPSHDFVAGICNG